MNKPYITGLHGCSCHPFNSWEECNKANRQVFKIGDPVKQRHTGKIGAIDEICTNPGSKGYVVVKYGKLPRDNEHEHISNLIKQE